jgi:hypothetical protein
MIRALWPHASPVVLPVRPSYQTVIWATVLALLVRVSRRLSEVGPEIIHGLLTDYFRDAELFAYLHAEVLQVGADAMQTIVRRAAERGEVRLDTISPRVSTLPIDLAPHELLVTRAPVPESVLVEIVDDIFLPLVHA